MKRVPALDGLRGVAVLLVLIAHMDGDIGEIGGKNGVAVFFVLSGYLITRVLLKEERINLKRFYLRRAKRLLPALTMVVVVSLAVGLVRGMEALWAMTYTTNFALAAGSGHHALSHTWTLAIEEHFYLLWPLALIGVRRNLPVVRLLAVASLAWALWVTATSAALRYQWATDTHAFMLLAGCVVGLARHRGVLASFSPRAGHLAVAGVIVLSFLSHPWVEASSRLVQFGVKAAPALLAVVAINADRMPLLEGRLLRWFGTISYGLYLWHVPVNRIAAPEWLLVIFSVAVAAGSWYLLERPILEGRLGRGEPGDGTDFSLRERGRTRVQYAVFRSDDRGPRRQSSDYKRASESIEPVG